jgi:hypothetical protein
VWPAAGMSASISSRHDLTVPHRHDDNRTKDARRSLNAAIPPIQRNFSQRNIRARTLAPCHQGPGPVFPTVVDITIRC